MAQCTDVAIQTTCDDASMCKRYAVQRGYWEDPFISHMVQGTGQRKQPEINRGYYARSESIWQLVTKFIESNQKKCQVISLGAGLDTTFWRLCKDDLHPQNYIEVDFGDVVNRKIRCISNRSQLHSCLEGFTSQQGSPYLHCACYHLVNADLRDISQLEESLNSCNLNYGLPTLFLTECVLIYMPPESSQAVLQWVADKFKDAVFVNYEQIHMNDAFGRVMISNLKARQCWLAGASACTTISSQEQRFSNAGWHQVVCRDMWTVYNSLPDKRRIERLEMLDEEELLQQLMEHYCLTVAIKDTSDVGLAILIR